jgi:hypothetical protein
MGFAVSGASVWEVILSGWQDATLIITGNGRFPHGFDFIGLRGDFVALSGESIAKQVGFV